MTRTKDTKGERTKSLILDSAVEIASVNGLEGLSIGGLAKELSMSKSGLFAHFGSKEELQVATVEHAREIFIEAVIRPAFKTPPGFERLRSLCEKWLAYSQGKVFKGGCFFAAAATEFDSKPGPVRDRIADEWRGWLSALETTIRKAQEEGEVNPSIDPRQTAFEINALAVAANTDSQLLGDKTAYRRSRVAIERRLQEIAVSTPRSKKHAG